LYGLKHGNGREQYVNRNTFEGSFKNGMYSNGTLIIGDSIRYTGEFNNNLFEGLGLYINNSNDYEYEGEWKSGEKDGIGKERFGDKLRIEGAWLNNKYEGLMRFIFSDQIVVSVAFENGVPKDVKEFEEKIINKLAQDPGSEMLLKHKPFYELTEKANKFKCNKKVQINLEMQGLKISHLDINAKEKLVSVQVKEIKSEAEHRVFEVQSESCIGGFYTISYAQEFPLINLTDRKKRIYLNGQQKEYFLILDEYDVHFN